GPGADAVYTPGRRNSPDAGAFSRTEAGRTSGHLGLTGLGEMENARLCRAVNRQRLLETAIKLVAVPSRTGEGGAVADCLADLLKTEGFAVERPVAAHAAAPAVVVR